MKQISALTSGNKSKGVLPANNLSELWTKRFSQWMNEIGKYGRLIFNDHFSIILFVLFGFGFMYYRDLAMYVNQSPQSLILWPVRIISFVLLWVIMQLGRPLWLTLDPDKSYLFPQGNQWKPYWLKGTFVAAIVPSILMLGLLSLLFPFITKVSPWQSHQFVLLSLILVLAKIFILLQIFLNSLQVKKVEGWLRQAPLAVLLVLILVPSQPWHLYGSLLWLVLWGSILAYQYFSRHGSHLQFEFVVDQENQRVTNYYKLVSAFADVPHLLPPVKRRPWLDKVIDRFGILNKNRYSYLYLRTLFRHTAYSSIWLRVLLFISVLLLFIQTPWLGFALGMLGHVMTLVQLLPMMDLYDNNPFQLIYPVSSDKLAPFVKTVRVILLLQSLIYLLISRNMIAGLIWIVFAELLLRLYVPWFSRRKQKQKQRN